MNQSITLEDLLATVLALESWVDAFEDVEENDEQIERVKKVLIRLNEVIAEMQGPDKPILRLVKPEIH